MIAIHKATFEHIDGIAKVPTSTFTHRNMWKKTDMEIQQERIIFRCGIGEKYSGKGKVHVLPFTN